MAGISENMIHVLEMGDRAKALNYLSGAMRIAQNLRDMERGKRLNELATALGGQKPDGSGT
jgi:hypothetical protein